jgi:hypothetical protein
VATARQSGRPGRTQMAKCANQQPLNRRCRITNATYHHGSFSHIVHLYLHASPRWEHRVLPFLLRSLPELFRWWGGLLNEFLAHTSAAVATGPMVPMLQLFEGKWLKLGVNLLNMGFPNEAGELFLRWYQCVRDCEIDSGGRFPKGTVLWWLGGSGQALRVHDDARNWHLLAMLEDVRSNAATWKQLPAYDSLVNGLQVSSSVIDALGDRAAVECAKSPWSKREPESLWIALVPHRTRFTRAPLPFLKSLARHLMSRASQAGLTKQQSGDALEEFLAYVFATERGFELLGETRAPDAQNDVLVRNGHLDGAVASMGPYFIVECKNWNKQARAPVIREFAGRLQTGSVKTGVLASRSGISGARPRTARSGARLAIAKEYVQDQTAILVFDEDQLKKLASGELSLTALLLSVFEDVRFDRI